MEANIDEGKIKGAIDSIELEKNEKICEQMKTCICKIFGDTIGTGFFCKILYNNEYIPVLITNYHVISDEYINQNTRLKISINNEKIFDIININEISKIYSSPREKYDIMIIKLKDEKYNYLELDDNLFNENSEEFYEEKSIYILHYPTGNKVSVSFGNGVQKIKDDYYIKHLCNTENCSSGSPILNLSTNKVIGIHKGRHQNAKKITVYNLGTLLKYPLNEMEMESKKSKNITKINNIKYINENYYISEKLKIMILLSISQSNGINKLREYSSENPEEVYLLDYNNLLKYKYDEISSLINENKDIIQIIENNNNQNYLYDSDILDKIISKINKDKLVELDKYFRNKELSFSNLKAKTEKMMLKENQSIDIYKQFFLVKQNIFKTIQDKFSIFPKSQNIHYIYQDFDIIINIGSTPVYMLFGNIMNNIFNLIYILTYDRESYLYDEINYIKKNGIKKYMEERVVFSDKNENDLISPIFSGNKIIGNFYKYLPGINYSLKSLKNDFTRYLNSEKLMKVLKLFDYYGEFKEKMKNNKNSKNNNRFFYLIDKSIMDDIKKEYNYDIIIQILSKCKFKLSENSNQKKILFILKNLPYEIFEEFIENKKIYEKRIKEYTAPHIKSFKISYLSINTYYYDNFEIIDPLIADLFIADINNLQGKSGKNSDKNCVECNLIENKVIIKFPKNNNECLYQIGILDDQNTFKIEYLLNYYRQYYNHFNNIMRNLNEYLSNVQFFEGTCPITSENYELIGQIIKMENKNSN